MTNAVITGELVLQEDEVQAASREAVGSEGLVMGSVGLAMLAGAVVGNLVVDETRGSWLMTVFSLPLTLVSLLITFRERARKVRQLAEQRARVARYQLDPQGLTISDQSASTRLEWRRCRGYEEGQHAFALYFESQVPELLMKRAFGAHDLDAVRDLLVRCLPATAVGRRALRRALVMLVVIGMFVLGCGIGLAIAVRH